MRQISLATTATVVLATSLLGQAVPGEAPTTPLPPTARSIGGGTNPLFGGRTLPKAYANKFATRYENVPLSSTSSRYQQVFLGSEVGTSAYRMIGLGFRHNPAFTLEAGAEVELEIKLGYTTYNPSTLTTSFGGNFNSGAAVTVLAKSKFQLVDFASQSQSDPTIFQVQIPFTTNFNWVWQANRNLLVEITVHSNSAAFRYPLDACTECSTTSLRGGVSATSGELHKDYGLVMCMLDRIQPTGTYTLFGTGCAGTGGKAGVIVPISMRTRIGSSNNYFGVGRANMRYQQIFHGSQVGRVRSFTGYFLRSGGRNDTGGTRTLEIKVSQTTSSPANMSATYATNITSTQTRVFNGTVTYPNMGGSTDPKVFKIAVPWTTPFIWVNPANQHLLFEIIDRSSANLFYYVDAHSGDTNMTRLYNSTGGTGATTGTIHRNYGLVMCLQYGGLGAIPALTNEGRPVIGKSFKVNLSDAKANTAAGLILGFSNTQWGVIPLPLDLTGFGAGGCFLRVSFDLLGVTAVDGQGNASITTTLPKALNLVGHVFHHQYFVIDSGANGMGLAWTNGGTAKIGEL